MKSKIHEDHSQKIINVSKKILFSLLVLAGITATAQVKVGSNPTTIDTGTTNFQVEGTTTAEQFVVLKNGRVGIGTTTPVSTFQIKRDWSSIALTNTAGTHGVHSQIHPTTGIYYDFYTPNQGATSTIFTYFDPATNSLSFNAGNVGIGTTAPFTNLHVSRVDAGTIARFDMSNGVSGSPQLQLETISNTAGAGFNLQAYAQGIGYSHLLLNGLGGNVGIGTTTPTSKLSVGNNHGVLLSIGNNLWASPNVITSGYDTDDYLQIQSPASTSSSIGIRINRSGNVGIGTTTPTQKLTVQGNIKFGDNTNTAKSGTLRFYSGDGGTNQWSAFNTVYFGGNAVCLGVWDESGNPVDVTTQVNTSDPDVKFLIAIP